MMPEVVSIVVARARSDLPSRFVTGIPTNDILNSDVEVVIHHRLVNDLVAITCLGGLAVVEEPRAHGVGVPGREVGFLADAEVVADPIESVGTVGNSMPIRRENRATMSRGMVAMTGLIVGVSIERVGGD